MSAKSTNFLVSIHGFELQVSILALVSVSNEIYDFTPCAHAQNNILHIKYAAKTDD